jgi:hypothetical protein
MSELYPVPSPTASNEKPKYEDSTNETPKQVNLLDIDVVDENSALNVLVGFIGLAQKRGVFAINESAKIYECIKVFKK